MGVMSYCEWAPAQNVWAWQEPVQTVSNKILISSLITVQNRTASCASLKLLIKRVMAFISPPVTVTKLQVTIIGRFQVEDVLEVDEMSKFFLEISWKLECPNRSSDKMVGIGVWSWNVNYGGVVLSVECRVGVRRVEILYGSDKLSSNFVF